MTSGLSTRKVLAAAVWAAVICIGGIGPLAPEAALAAAAVQAGPDDVKIRVLLQHVEQIAQRGDSGAYLELLAESADRKHASEFADLEFHPVPARVVIQERDRQPLPGTLPGNGYSLTVDTFMDYGGRGRVATWQLSVKRVEDDWRIAGQERVSAVENLYRLSVNPKKQFDAHNFTLLSEDIELTLVDGTVFVVETEQGVTGLVLLGHGSSPAPKPSSRGLMRRSSGSGRSNCMRIPPC